ncbi:glycoside hydrolase [Zymoseptoria tritici IPO323]|uniref:alpha-galactosidase n=1 Tax=Zymoseptoria tritici (strain CBS 115943 / IPO323) TaxID=336722 RepID=F9XGN0_ZYMTI|nr:glycoside hydrolase [Zymoseptoria tritici IPO323]EGP86007.1 glycoside hydrolase [Zymoseptoria tritici IPO323]
MWPTTTATTFVAGAVLVGGVLGQSAINAQGTNFTLTADNASYLFHVDPETLDLTSDHFGGPSTDFVTPGWISTQGWLDGLSIKRREFPNIGSSDVRLPAIHIQHSNGTTVTEFRYQSHRIVEGKPDLPGLPATYGEAGDVSTLIVQLYDNVSDIGAALSYSVFPAYNAIARSFQITNNGSGEIIIERAASFSLDLPNLDLEMLELHGDWSHEGNRIKRKVDFGETGFRSSLGYSSHLYNPFFALMSPSTTETTGEAWGFNLIYTGSFAATVERISSGLVRVLLGMNPLHSSLHVQPGESWTSPEAVGVYSSTGLGGMSRSFHDLYRNHLSRAKQTNQTRPVLLNSWEGLGFGINDTAMVTLAGEAADLGIELLVMDDGWFGVEYPRNNDTLGLGDWTPNPAKFPVGLNPFITEITSNITVANASSSSSSMRFGLWVEPEMISPNSTLYHEHPDWALHSGSYTRSLTRSQLVLNVGLPEVQEFIITSVSRILNSAPISYVKWDNNRGMHELPTPSAEHTYMLGLYNILNNLTTTFPDVLFEGCASGGGRFDPGILHYWPQSWTSDNTDASDRLTIQLGMSVVYPPSAMGCHISAVPNGLTHRNISIEYRADVALMCGSFGFELNPDELSAEETAAIPGIMEQWRQLNPLVIAGDFYRLAIPQESNWPAVQFVSKDKSESAVFMYQQQAKIKPSPPPVRLVGLDAGARYTNDWDNATYTGATYMSQGLSPRWKTEDYQSKVVWGSILRFVSAVPVIKPYTTLSYRRPSRVFVQNLTNLRLNGSLSMAGENRSAINDARRRSFTVPGPPSSSSGF